MFLNHMLLSDIKHVNVVGQKPRSFCPMACTPEHCVRIWGCQVGNTEGKIDWYTENSTMCIRLCGKDLRKIDKNVFIREKIFP